jgi:hypothetical protein
MRKPSPVVFMLVAACLGLLCLSVPGELYAGHYHAEWTGDDYADNPSWWNGANWSYTPGGPIGGPDNTATDTFDVSIVDWGGPELSGSATINDIYIQGGTGWGGKELTGLGTSPTLTLVGTGSQWVRGGMRSSLAVQVAAGAVLTVVPPSPATWFNY